MARTRKKLGEILMGWGIIDESGLAQGLEYGMQNGKRIGEALVELELCSQEDVMKALATQLGLEYVDLERDPPSKESLNLIPADLIRKHLVLPVEEEGDRLKLIITDPLDLDTFDLLKFRLGKEIQPLLAAEGKVKAYIEEFLAKMTDDLSQTMASIDRASIDLEDELEKKPELSAEEEDADSPVVRLVNRILSEAVRIRASISTSSRWRTGCAAVPHRRGVRGARQPAQADAERGAEPPEADGGHEHRREADPAGRPHQDARRRQQIDFRVSACPAYHGESVVLRILRPDAVRIGLPNLGFEPDNLEIVQQDHPQAQRHLPGDGARRVRARPPRCTPALDVLNRPDRKIITAEDPVEYNFDGINQCQVRDSIGLTFPAILRSMLRQAPNIILVGEIRDREVGEIAIQAALTGPPGVLARCTPTMRRARSRV
jgi:type IV pilus assembly protein PilB